ncbi:MAG: hemolysin family protein [Saprospiraceae bacterium]|nr:HlyC/CorC family transporter [Saprospiraceae bacterium]MBK9221845.1 HlyC/CorC family transporter [Saprospiraceae bacterium]
MVILIILTLILINGIFSMSEMSLVSSRKFKLENAKRKGSKGAKTALELSENPSKFLSTVQIGITLIGILLGVYSDENLTKNVTAYLITFEPLIPYASYIATGAVVIFVTYLSIILGELLPKRLGMTFPEPIAIRLARPMQIISVITSPFVWLLTSTNEILLKLIGIKKTSESKVSEEEIKSIIKESAEGGEIQDIEHNIMERVFEMGDRKVNTLFTHRGEIVYFTTSDTWEEIKFKINQEKHSAYPVTQSNNLDDILGIVLLKDLFTPTADKEFNILDYVKNPLYLNENTYAYKVLELFKKEKMHYGIVVDEYGTTIGIVTMDDVVDALIGEVTENDQDEYQITQRNENSWFVDGQYSIFDFVKYFDIELDENYQNKFTTVAGLVIYKNNTLPEIGEKFDFDKYELEIIDKDGQRIDKILVTKK